MIPPEMFAANTVAWWAPQVRAGDVVRWPYGAGETAPIDERDSAALAVRALSEASLVGGDYVLTGPAALSHARQVDVIGEVLGRRLALHFAPSLRRRFNATRRTMDRTAFDDFFDEQMADPVRAEAYREARAEIDTYDRFMRAMNALRKSRGVSKAALASKSGLPAQSVRKVLTDRKANPTIATIFRMLSTMGFGLRVVPLKRKTPRRPSAKSRKGPKGTSAGRRARAAAG